MCDMTQRAAARARVRARARACACLRDVCVCIHAACACVYIRALQGRLREGLRECPRFVDALHC